MKFNDTKTGSPYRWGKHEWYINTYCPFGTETMHGPYRTKKRARWAQHGLKKRTTKTNALYEKEFWEWATENLTAALEDTK